MASNWNRYLEQLLAAQLTVAEYRLALALGRELFGWNRREAYLGRALLRDRSGLDGRAFERARDGLVAKGLLAFTPGKPGRGNRARYELLPEEKAAPQRPLLSEEKAAPQRPKAKRVKGRSPARKKAALQRPRRGKGLNHPRGTIQAQAIDSYLASGGNLELADRKNALLAHTTRLAKAGVPEHVILAAVSSLGRENAFPGYLTQRADEIQTNGGPCQWDGLDRSRLTHQQLTECNCANCKTWAHASINAVSAAA
jgi:hypothetical protein